MTDQPNSPRSEDAAAQSEARRRGVITTLVVIILIVLVMVAVGAMSAGNFTGFESLTLTPESSIPAISWIL